MVFSKSVDGERNSENKQKSERKKKKKKNIETCQQHYYLGIACNERIKTKYWIRDTIELKSTWTGKKTKKKKNNVVEHHLQVQHHPYFECGIHYN